MVRGNDHIRFPLIGVVATVVGGLLYLRHRLARRKRDAEPCQMEVKVELHIAHNSQSKVMRDSVKSLMFDVNDYPQIIQAFGEDDKNEAKKYALFLYKHFITGERQNVRMVDWVTGQNLRAKPLVAAPARLRASAGYLREWAQIADGHQVLPALRAAERGERPATVNGFVALQYTEAQYRALAAFYRASGRARFVEIPLAEFEPVGWEALPDVQTVLAVVPDRGYWVRPCPAYPVLQTYLDQHLSALCRHGGESGEAFAEEFLRTTRGFGCWLNDRPNRRRPWLDVESYRFIEGCLATFPRAADGRPSPWHAARVNNESELKCPGQKIPQEHYEATGRYQAHPKVWMFGYGSLISTPSRTSSSPTATTVIPVVVGTEANLKRIWNFRATPVGSTVGPQFVAAGLVRTEPGKGWEINGICYPLISGTTIDQIREREKGYEFVRIDRAHVRQYPAPNCWQRLPEDAEIWVCGPPEEPDKYAAVASARHPLLQTYVDVCVSGCLEHGEVFAKMFAQTTDGWNEFWINDREIPRRPWVSNLISQKCWSVTDTLLGEELLSLRLLPEEYSAVHACAIKQELAKDLPKRAIPHCPHTGRRIPSQDIATLLYPNAKRNDDDRDGGHEIQAEEEREDNINQARKKAKAKAMWQRVRREFGVAWQLRGGYHV